MPADREAERAVLAVSIQSPVARAVAKARITGHDFDAPEHEAIWDAISRLERHGKEVGWITLNHVLAGNTLALSAMPELVTCPAFPDQVADYADIVRDKATLRRLSLEANSVLGLCERAGVSGRGLAAKVATRFAAIRDSGITDDDMAVVTLEELLAIPDEPYDWVIKDLLERSDRLILTGEEGLGKSHLLRQIAVMAAAGIHPFNGYRVEPCKSLIIDCENTQRQVRRHIGPLAEYAGFMGSADPGNRVTIDNPGRIDITADRDLAKIHHMLDATMPDIVIIGPLYRLVPRALQTDDEAAPLLTALDSIRERGIALLIEAHSGHGLGRQGVRDMRPRGSSALLGWPEFGYGMRGNDKDGTCEFTAWRGNRDEREWPTKLRRDPKTMRWLQVDDGFGPGALT